MEKRENTVVSLWSGLQKNGYKPVVSLWSGLWKNGDKKEIGAGRHYMAVDHQGFDFGCFEVPEGLQLTIYNGLDGTGMRSPMFQVGFYPHLSYYGSFGNNKCVIYVEETVWKKADMCTLYLGTAWEQGDRDSNLDYDGFHKWFKFPPGKYAASSSFPDNSIFSVYVPEDTSLTLWERANSTGENIVLDAGVHHLVDYNFTKRVSSVELTRNEFEFVKFFSYIDKAIRIPQEDRVSTITLVNEKDIEAQVSQTITDSWKVEDKEEWNAEAGVSRKSSISGGGFIFGGVSVTKEVEVSVSAGYGQAETNDRDVSIEREVIITLSGKGIAHADLIVQVEKIVIPVKRLWRNVRTGKEITEYGTITTEYASDSKVRVY